ncbi:MAG: glycosyltransferase family 2 protein [Desulfobacteraceae bacterium]|nr:glycosyltransferase family 2 protein [Desulfobacteraceae bacterium]MCF8094801.1 glycosyltransferase family 2 protein [Desulfobacteraceae bacterium]
MKPPAEFVFWISILMVGYAYIGYPLILYGLSRVCKKSVRRDTGYQPHVSLIITVYNEQARIAKKIENTLALDYPADRLEIIFASDASTDKTDEIVDAYPEFRLIRAPQRRGKEFAQKCAVDQASGKILVFSDVATMLDPEGLKNIVANFADPTVGCVSSEDRFIDEKGRVSGEGAYVKYEMLLRRLESRVYSVVGLSGSFFAARRKVCAHWAVDLQSDFNTLLNSLKLGLRGVSDPDSLGYYHNISDEKKEFSRKVRTVLRGIAVLMRNRDVLNPVHYGLFSWEIFSHKLCRWLVPFFLVLALVANILLISASGFYASLLVLQIAFYLLAGVYALFQFGSPREKKQKAPLAPFINILKIPYYFIVVNAAILAAWIKFARGERAVYWEPSKR